MTRSQRITLGILTAGLLFTYGPIVYGGNFDSGTPWGLVILTFAFLFVPYLLLATAVRQFGRERAAILVLMMGAVLMTGIGLAVLYFALFVSTDPYAFLYVLMAPVVQIAIAILTAGPAAYIAMRARRREAEPAE